MSWDNASIEYKIGSTVFELILAKVIIVKIYIQQIIRKPLLIVSSFITASFLFLYLFIRVLSVWPDTLMATVLQQ